jgi:glycosyltransferase involved in cell wall biosynthesis
MRFAIISPFIGPNDGQGRVNAAIVAEALRRGHEVLVLAEHAAIEPDPLGRLHCLDVPPPAWLPSRLLRDQFLAVQTWAHLCRRANRCDAVLANGFTSWARTDVNLVHFVHAAWARSPYHPWHFRPGARAAYALAYNRLNIVLERIAFRHARRVVAISDGVRQELVSAGVPADRISIVTNGVDTAEFHPGPAQRSRFGLPHGVPIALFAGDLRSPRKNLDTVLRAMPTVPGLHLAVAGRQEGSLYPDLARALGVAERVHFLGFCSDMPALMRSVTLLAFPSRYEPCGLVLLEALASGLPVLTTRNAGAAELMADDVGIVLEDSEDCDAMAAALRHLAQLSGPSRGALARRARALAERHSWSRVAQSHVDLLEAIVVERRAMLRTAVP